MLVILVQIIVLFPVIFVLLLYDKKTSDRCHLFGIEGYFGLMGQGKTICMTKRLIELRKSMVILFIFVLITFY